MKHYVTPETHVETVATTDTMLVVGSPLKDPSEYVVDGSGGGERRVYIDEEDDEEWEFSFFRIRGVMEKRW